MPRRKDSQPDGTVQALATQDVQHAIVALDGLTPHPRNYRRHPEAQLARLSASLARFGQVRSIVVQEGADGRYLLVAGHGLTEAARANGYTELRADVIPATWTPQQVEGYLIADNETTRGADDDLVQLAAMLEEQRAAGEHLESLGYSDEELAALLDDLSNAALAEGQRDVDDPDGGGDDFDTTPDESGPTRCQRGDLWQLGKHRLLCGDSTRAEDVARLMDGARAVIMATDPPYGANAGNIGFTAQRDEIDVITNDELTDEAMQHWLESVFRAWLPSLDEHAAWYLWHPMLTQGYFAAAAAAADVLIHRQIIWVKEQFIFGRGDYHWKHELCFYGWRKGSRPPFYGQRNQSTVWEIAWGEKRSEVGHPTAKPIVLFAIPMENHTKPKQICAEPFAGSGSQVIAGERLGRIVYAMELEPRYCDVILRRWEAETGREATLLERAERASGEEAQHASA